MNESPSTLSQRLHALLPPTSLRFKLILPTLGLTLLTIGLLTWFASNTVQSTVNKIYLEKARAVASLVSKAIIDKEYILFYSEKINQDIKQLVQLYPDVFRITIYGKVRNDVRVITSSDPTRIGQEVAASEAPALLSKTASIELYQEGKRSFYQVRYPLYQASEIIGLTEVDLSLEERDAFLQEIYANFALGGFISFLALGGLLYIVLHAVVSKPIYKLAHASEKVSTGDYTVLVDHGPVPDALVRDEIQRLIRQFNHMMRMIKENEERLQAMIVTDQLTGVYNRQHFDHLAQNEIERASRYQHPLSFMLIDILRLDQINLKYGQTEGDRTLRRVAELLTATFRQVDEVSRYGGDEFIVIMPETDEQGTAISADRLRQKLTDLNHDAPLPVQLNIAFSTWRPEPEVGWRVDKKQELAKILGQISAATSRQPL